MGVADGDQIRQRGNGRDCILGGSQKKWNRFYTYDAVPWRYSACSMRFPNEGIGERSKATSRDLELNVD